MRNELLDLYKMAMNDHNDKDIVRAYQRARDRIGPMIVMDEVLACDNLRARLAEVEAQRDELIKAVTPLVVACEVADSEEELCENVEGRLICNAREALAKLEEK